MKVILPVVVVGLLVFACGVEGVNAGNDKEASADHCPGVDLDASQKSAQIGKHARQPFKPMIPQPMG